MFITVLIIILFLYILYKVGQKSSEKRNKTESKHNTQKNEEAIFPKIEQEDDFVSNVYKKIEEAQANKNQTHDVKVSGTEDLVQEALNSVQQNEVVETVASEGNKDLYTLVYCDAEGNASKRDIIFRNLYEENEKLYIQAFCLLRNAVRSFALERIVKIWHSGKEIENPAEYFLQLYQNSDVYKAKLFLDKHVDEIACLVFVARADGAMQKNERDAIIEYCASFNNDFDTAVLENPIKSLDIDVKTFNLLLKSCKSWDLDVKNKAKECVKKIVSARKNPDPMEVAAGEKMLRALS